MWINVCGLCILVGLNTGVATFVSQSIGQENLKLCGVYLNRARIVGFLFYIPIGLLIMNAEFFFLLFEIDVNASSYA